MIVELGRRGLGMTFAACTSPNLQDDEGGKRKTKQGRKDSTHISEGHCNALRVNCNKAIPLSIVDAERVSRKDLWRLVVSFCCRITDAFAQWGN
jgi:hypothetical protein